MKKPLFWASILGAAKLFSDSLGYTFITNEQVNIIADGIAALITVAGVAVSHDTIK